MFPVDSYRDQTIMVFSAGVDSTAVWSAIYNINEKSLTTCEWEDDTDVRTFRLSDFGA